MEIGLITVGACTGVTLLIVVVSLAVTASRTRTYQRTLEKLFEGRSPQTPQQFHDRYFAAKGIPFFVTSGVVKVLENELQADLSRLAADDDFAGNLAFLRGKLEHPETMLSLEKVFEVTISESDVHEMGTTVEDVVLVVWRTLNKKRK